MILQGMHRAIVRPLWAESPSYDLPRESFGEQASADSESHLRALGLIVRLGQPFHAFLLAQQRGGEYTRVASDCDILAQVRDMISVRKITQGIMALEIL